MSAKQLQIVFIGCGAAARNVASIARQVDEGIANAGDVVVVDQFELAPEVRDAFRLTFSRARIRIVQRKLLPDNLANFFDEYVRPRSPVSETVVIELATRISTSDLLTECERKGAVFVNTALDDWTAVNGLVHDWEPLNRDKAILLVSEGSIIEQTQPHECTAIVNCGQNPGAVSAYTKAALARMARDPATGRIILKDGPAPEAVAANRELDGGHEWYSRHAEQLELTLVQITERDSQRTELLVSEESNTMISTWSVTGGLDEAVLPFQASIGSHERSLPSNAQAVAGHPFHYSMPIRGYQMRMLSWEPTFGTLTGYPLAHAECATIPRFLNTATHRVSSYYCYQVPGVMDITAHYLYDNYLRRPVFNFKVLDGHEILPGGYDSVGCLMFFGNGQRFWIGSVVTKEWAAQISGNDIGAPTLLQVAGPVLAAARWALDNPRRGIVEPEVLDPEYLLAKSYPCLGPEIIVRDVTELTRDLPSDQLRDLMVCPRSDAFTWVSFS